MQAKVAGSKAEPGPEAHGMEVGSGDFYAGKVWIRFVQAVWVLTAAEEVWPRIQWWYAPQAPVHCKVCRPAVKTSTHRQTKEKCSKC